MLCRRRNRRIVTDIWAVFANGSLGVLIVAVGGRWALERVPRMSDARLAALTFVLGLSLGRLGAAGQSGSMGARVAGMGGSCAARLSLMG